jgi:hypothetical protein
MNSVGHVFDVTGLMVHDDGTLWDYLLANSPSRSLSYNVRKQGGCALFFFDRNATIQVFIIVRRQFHLRRISLPELIKRGV